MARTPDLELYVLWRDRVRRQTDSGLTIAQFCARGRLAVASFSAWKRCLRLMDLAEGRSALPAPSAFLTVTVRGLERAADEPAPIEADLPNGIRLRRPTLNAHLACRLIRAVAGTKADSGGSR